MIQAEKTKTPREYIYNRQVTIAEWVALRTIFEVCTKDMGYEVGGRIARAVVTAGGCGATTGGHVEKYLGRREGAAVTGI